MDHSGHDHGYRGDARRLIAAFAVIAVFMVIEVIGGILAGSLALLADAAHMLTDALALALAAGAHWFSRKPANGRLHFGYRRAQVLAAFMNGVTLAFLLGWIVIEGIRRLFVPVEVNWPIMMVVAGLGLGANAVALFILNDAQSENLNVRGALLHVVSDLLGSIAAIIAAGVIALTSWSQIDPILSFVVAILIGRSAYRLIRETGHILLEGAPENVDIDALVSGLKEAAPGVRDVHHVRVWQLTPEHPRLTMHLSIDKAEAAPDVLEKAKAYLDRNFGISQSTIQVEIGEHCPDCECRTVGPVEVHCPVNNAAKEMPVRESGRPGGASVAFASTTK